MNKQFIILMAAVLLTSLVSYNAFAENSNCRGDCVAPTIGTLDNDQVMVINGFAINGQSFNVTGYSQKILTPKFLVNQPITVKMLVYENSGVQALRQVDLTISDYKDERNRNDKASISFNRDFTGLQKIDVLDPAKILNNVKVNAIPVDQFVSSIVFTFDFQKPVNKSSIIVDMADDSRSSRRNILLDSVMVENKNAEKIKDVKTIENKVTEKKDVKTVEKKDIEKKDTEHVKKEKSSKTQVGKGKKNQRTNVK
ncbi:MAG: hypothetical protein EPO63_04290 [Candidatus Nitrosotenuis sp.]|nr:MAG: hypothetical protein EPO63_04290 [Candidatus Nitrosotenuis sp.]